MTNLGTYVENVCTTSTVPFVSVTVWVLVPSPDTSARSLVSGLPPSLCPISTTTSTCGQPCKNPYYGLRHWDMLTVTRLEQRDNLRPAAFASVGPRRAAGYSTVHDGDIGHVLRKLGAPSTHPRSTRAISSRSGSGLTLEFPQMRSGRPWCCRPLGRASAAPMRQR
jgi:hypothetical protein